MLLSSHEGLLITQIPPTNAGGTQVRTRAVDVSKEGKAEWNEQLVLDLAAPSGELAQVSPVLFSSI